MAAAPRAAGALPFAGIAGLIFLVTALRLPSTFVYPSFWAEDGTVFFKDSIELGAAALVKPIFGSVMTIPRILAALARLFPVEAAPALYPVGAGLVSSVCLALFSRPGFRWIVPSDSLRAALCLGFTLVPGMIECFFSLTTLIYLLFVAVVLLLLEREEDGQWAMSAQRAALVSFLWFSVGQSVVLTPLLLFLWWRTRRAPYGACLAALVPSVLLNLTSDNATHAPATVPSLPTLMTVFLDNLFVRVLYLPLLGHNRLTWTLGLPPAAFVSISGILAALLVWGTRRTTAIDREGWGALGLALLCGMTTFPLTTLTRHYALPVLARPNLIFGVRYEVFPSILALILTAAIVVPLGYGWRRLAAAAALVLVASHLMIEPLYQAPQPYRPFAWEWPRQAQRIESALARRDAGRLRRHVVIDNIGCRPGWGIRIDIAP